MNVPRTERTPATPNRVERGSRRWLLFVHQLPSNPSNLRVRTWRRLQHLGALPIKQAVYVLPDTPTAREDFEWLKAEVKGAGGDASVFEADNVDAWSDDALVEEFRRTRQDAYAPLVRRFHPNPRLQAVIQRSTVDGPGSRVRDLGSIAWRRRGSSAGSSILT